MPETTVRIACIQMEPSIGDLSFNREKCLGYLEDAHRNGARIAVLPELANSGYVFESRDEAFSLAEPVPEGPTTAAWMAFAAEKDMIIVAGIAENDDGKLYNSAVAIGPDGHIGTYRKNHLWAAENLFFEPGNRGVPVWHTRYGRIAAAICYDCWFPEIFRMAAVQGADLLCIPTNWVPMPDQPDDMPVMANILAMSAAHSNSLFIAAADRVGTERQQLFLGRSLIVGHRGWPVAGPASANDEEIIYADVDLSNARRKRSLNEFNQPLRDRRIDLYGETLGADVERSWY
ncbi:MAG: nitrilase family protein [Pseudomonadota bacterium]